MALKDQFPTIELSAASPFLRMANLLKRSDIKSPPLAVAATEGDRLLLKELDKSRRMTITVATGYPYFKSQGPYFAIVQMKETLTCFTADE